MVSQSPSTNSPNMIDVGNCIVYYSGSAFSTLSAAASATTYKKLGILKNGSQFERLIEKLPFYSGTPLRLQKQFFTREECRVSGEMLEFSPKNFELASGITPTVTLFSSTPSPTTTTTGATQSSISVASASNFAADDLIKVGSQYGIIKSISSNTFTMYDGLDGGTNPTVGDAVSKVQTVTFKGGSSATPPEIAIKISKTLVAGFGTVDIYLPRVQVDGNITSAWADGSTTVEGVGLPFVFDGLSLVGGADDGYLFQALFTQT